MLALCERGHPKRTVKTEDGTLKLILTPDPQYVLGASVGLPTAFRKL